MTAFAGRIGGRRSADGPRAASRLARRRCGPLLRAPSVGSENGTRIDLRGGDPASSRARDAGPRATALHGSGESLGPVVAAG